MYTLRKLEKLVNDTLYRSDYVSDLKGLLPFKNVTVEQTEKVLEVVDSVGVLYSMLQDVLVLLTGEGTLKTSSARGFEAKLKVMSTRVERALNESNALSVVKVLKSVDKDACVVGGCVRDSLMGREPKDWDFVTSVEYSVLEWYFVQAGFTTKETGKEFLVLNVSKNGENYEVARYRKDGMYSNGRHPDTVEVGTLDDDAHRRDFTVNALYYRLSDGALLDPTGKGLDDADLEVLRFVGNPKDRLADDYLRGWRFYRFLHKGFEPDPKSLRAVRDMWQVVYEKSNPQRVMLEVEKMLNL